MTVEIINVGTELLLGEIVNTNATRLQQYCRELGFNVYHQTVVGDNPARFKECLRIAFERGADCVITTGGLGPTGDDLTKELSAEFLGLPMVFMEEEAKKVEAKCRFVSNYDTVPENNFRQAWFPAGCLVLENEVGTANGCVMEKNGRRIVNLPGPPKEMNYVCEHQLIPYLSRFRKDTIYTCEILTVGMGESRLELALKELIDTQGEVTVALYASEQTVRVRLACKAPSRELAAEKMAPIEAEVRRIAADYLVEQSDLTQALKELLPPFRVEYQSGFRFRPEFLLAQSNGNELVITVNTEPHPLGERLVLEFFYQGRKGGMALGLLKKASLSHPKLEARTVNALYTFLKR